MHKYSLFILNNMKSLGGNWSTVPYHNGLNLGNTRARATGGQIYTDLSCVANLGTNIQLFLFIYPPKNGDGDGTSGDFGFGLSESPGDFYI